MTKNKTPAQFKSQLTNALLSACQKGDLKSVKNLLTSESTASLIDIHTHDLKSKYGISIPNLPLKYACQYGHQDIVEYLLTSKELKENARINYPKDNSPLRYAVSGKQEHIIKFLLTSDKLKEHADIRNHSIISSAITKNGLPIVKMLLTSKELPQHALLYLPVDKDILAASIKCKYYDITEYLIIEMNYKIPDDILPIVTQDDIARKIVEAKEMYEMLQKDLPNNKIERKNIKI